MADDIINDKDRRNYPTAISAINSLLKTIGGFQADRLPPENLAAKLLDTKKAEELNKALNAYYSDKYLAGNPDVKHIESTPKDTDSPEVVNFLQCESTSDMQDKKTEQELPDETPVTPHDPPASSTTSPSLTCDGFSEKGNSKNMCDDFSEKGDISDCDGFSEKVDSQNMGDGFSEKDGIVDFATFDDNDIFDNSKGESKTDE